MLSKEYKSYSTNFSRKRDSYMYVGRETLIGVSFSIICFFFVSLTNHLIDGVINFAFSVQLSD